MRDWDAFTDPPATVTMAPRGRQQRALSALRHHLRPGEDGMLLAASPAGGSACSSPSSGSSDGSALFRPGFRFDRVAWERDGYLVLPDVLTDEARERWLSTLQRLQRIQDEITLRTDWNDGAAWASLGLRPREPRATAADYYIPRPTTKEEDGGLLGLIPGAHHFRGEYYDTSSLLLLLVQSISVDLF